MTAPQPVLVVVGAGPGIGASVARRFGAQGYAVGLIARNRVRLEALVADLASAGVTASAGVADARNPGQLRSAIAGLSADLGPVEVLCFSPLPDVALIGPVLETSAEELMSSVELNLVGAATAAESVVPAMQARGTGTILFTTGSAGLSPSADRAASGVTTTATTVYVRMLHDALDGSGVHVAHTVIVGPVGPRAGEHHPDEVARELWERHVRRDEPMTVLRL